MIHVSRLCFGDDGAALTVVVESKEPDGNPDGLIRSLVVGESCDLMECLRIPDRKTGKEVYVDDIIRVYDMNVGCVCDEWKDCENESGKCEEHGEHFHENISDCENFLCEQVVEKSALGYFVKEDNGEYCPSLGADEIEVEVIGNIHQNPSLIHP